MNGSYIRTGALLVRVPVGDIVDQVRYCDPAITLKSNITTALYFSFAAMKQQDLSPNLMLILWLVIVPAAVMGAAIAGGDAKIFAESEGPTG